jgi:hypothetical protein
VDGGERGSRRKKERGSTALALYYIVAERTLGISFGQTVQHSSARTAPTPSHRNTQEYNPYFAMNRLEYNFTTNTLCTHKGSCLSEVAASHCDTFPAEHSNSTMWPRRIRCWLASHDLFLHARSSYKLLSLSRAATNSELPDAAIILATPQQCFNFVTRSELQGVSTPSKESLAMRKALLVSSKTYPHNASDWRLVVLDNGACLQFFVGGIPQRVSELSQEFVLGRWPLLSIADYARLLPPRSRPSERALFRSSYSDPELLAELRNGSDSAPHTGLRRPAFIVSTKQRYQVAAAEVWRAGFEPTLLPGIYANTSSCTSNASVPGTKMAHIINLQNVIDAFRNAQKKILMRNVPHAIFEDDASALERFKPLTQLILCRLILDRFCVRC